MVMPFGTGKPYTSVLPGASSSGARWSTGNALATADAAVGVGACFFLPHPNAGTALTAKRAATIRGVGAKLPNLRMVTRAEPVRDYSTIAAQESTRVVT